MPFSVVRDLWLVIKAKDEGSRALRGFARDIRMVGDTVAQQNMRAARSALSNTLARDKLRGATRAEMLATFGQIAALDKQINSSKIARAAAEEHRVGMQRLSSSLTGVSTVLGAVGLGMTAAGIVGVVAMKRFIDFAVDYQKQTALTRTQVDGLRYSTKQLGDVGLRVAATVPVAFEQIQPALYDLFSSLEIGIGDAEKLLKSFAKAAVAGGTDVQSVSRATIGFLNAFHLPLSDVNHLLDVQFQLVQEGIGTYDEWVKRIGLATPSAARYGQSIEMLSAALAASTRMGITAARSTTAVSRAMDAMSNPKAVKALKGLGIAALDSKGNFRPMIDVLKEFRAVLMKIPKSERIKKILDVFKGAGGTIEARRFLQNMLLLPGNIETFEAIFKEMTTTTGSFQSAYEIMANTVAGKSQQLSNHWSILKVTAGEALIPAFLRIISAVQGVLMWFNNLSPSTKQLITQIAIISSIIMGLVGVLLLVVAGLTGFFAVIAVTGAALFVTLGILLAAGVAFAALGAAIFIAWKKSEGFRDLLEGIAFWARKMYFNAILPAAKGVADAWTKYMQPALSELGAVMEKDVMPVVRRLSDMFNRELLDTIKEVANWVKDMLVNAFKFIGAVIKNVVIPIIKDLTKFYYAHEGTIKQLIGWMSEAVKWFLKIAAVVGGILVVLFVGPVVLAFVAVIGIIIALIMIITKVIEWVKMLIKWFSDFGSHMAVVGEFFKGVWNSIAEFFIGIWNGIKTFFIAIWNSIIAFFMPALEFLRAAWEGFWSVFGGLIKAVWNLIVALVRLAILTILLIIITNLKALQAFWNTVWGGIKLVAITVWNAIFGFLKMVWNAIYNFFVGWGTRIRNYFVGIWNTVFNFIRTRTQGIRDWIAGVWNNILAGARTAWNNFYTAIASALGRAWTEVTRIVGRIQNFFAGAINWLRSAGGNIIQGLIDGITSQIGRITDVINNVARTIRDRLPFSPAKAGPLSGRGNPFYGGQNIVDLISRGMSSRISALTNLSNTLAAQSASTAFLSRGETAGAGTNQSITIYTNEINPRRHAEELGWLLAGR